MFVFFQVQAAWAVMFAMPVWAASEAARALDWLDALGVSVWLAGILGESIADRQLARFRADPPVPRRRATPGCGAGRGTPTTSSNGCSGGASWRWVRAPDTGG